MVWNVRELRPLRLFGSVEGSSFTGSIGLVLSLFALWVPLPDSVSPQNSQLGRYQGEGTRGYDQLPSPVHTTSADGFNSSHPATGVLVGRLWWSCASWLWLRLPG